MIIKTVKDCKYTQVNNNKIFKFALERKYIKDFEYEEIIDNNLDVKLDFKLKLIYSIFYIFKSKNKLISLIEYLSIIFFIFIDIIFIFDIYYEKLKFDIYHINGKSYNLKNINDCIKLLENYTYISSPCKTNRINEYKIKLNFNNALYNNNHFIFIALFLYFIIKNIIYIYKNKPKIIRMKNFLILFFFNIYLISKNIIILFLLLFLINSEMIFVILFINISFSTVFIFFKLYYFRNIKHNKNFLRNELIFTLFFLPWFYYLNSSRLLKIDWFNSYFYIIILILLIGYIVLFWIRLSYFCIYLNALSLIFYLHKLTLNMGILLLLSLILINLYEPVSYFKHVLILLWVSLLLFIISLIFWFIFFIFGLKTKKFYLNKYPLIKKIYKNEKCFLINFHTEFQKLDNIYKKIKFSNHINNIENETDLIIKYIHICDRKKEIYREFNIKDWYETNKCEYCVEKINIILEVIDIKNIYKVKNYYIKKIN